VRRARVHDVTCARIILIYRNNVGNLMRPYALSLQSPCGAREMTSQEAS
jgi:hypothetical protein